VVVEALDLSLFGQPGDSQQADNRDLARRQLPRDDRPVRAEDRATQGCDLSAVADANTGDGDREIPVFFSGLARKAINPKVPSIESAPQILRRSHTWSSATP